MEETFTSERRLQERARQFIMAAEEHLSTKKFLENIFGRSTTRFDKALKCYLRAANLFRLTKNWKEASETFVKVANLSNINHQDVAQYFVSAANCYRKYNPDKAIECLLKAVVIYSGSNKYMHVAANHKKIAEIYETSSGNFRGVIDHYEQAAENYKTGEYDTLAHECLIKAAYIYSKEFCEYSKAIEIFEYIALSEKCSPLLRGNVNSYYFKASLCLLCGDIAKAKKSITEYLEAFPLFGVSAEYKFLNEVLRHIEANEIDKFTLVVANYDSNTRLEPWDVTMLLRIKDSFP